MQRLEDELCQVVREVIKWERTLVLRKRCAVILILFVGLLAWEIAHYLI